MHLSRSFAQRLVKLAYALTLTLNAASAQTPASRRISTTLPGSERFMPGDFQDC